MTAMENQLTPSNTEWPGVETNLPPALLRSAVLVSGITRAVLVFLVCLFNVRALVNLSRCPSPMCLHLLTSGAIFLGNVMYLTGWLPFIVYGLCNGRWTIMSSRTYCLLQHFNINALGMVLLALLAVRCIDALRVRVCGLRALTGREGLLLLLAVWIIPQLIYDLISVASSRAQCQTPVFHFLDDITRLMTTNSNVHDDGSSLVVYRIGFMICQQELNPVSLQEYLWQFAYLVIPLCTVILYSTLYLFAHDRKKRTSLSCHKNHFQVCISNKDRRCSPHCIPNCRTTDFILYSNLAWHMFIRPLMILHALYSTPLLFPSMFIDLGSHLVLTLSTIFAPQTATKLRETQDTVPQIKSKPVKDFEDVPLIIA